MAFIITKPLIDQKQEFIIKIDNIAGNKRLEYITSTPGQEVTYTAKLADAQAYKAAGYPIDVSTYPWINAEANATGNSPTNVADFIIYTAAIWEDKGSKIEGARQAAKISVSSATTITEIKAVINTYVNYLATI